MKKLNDFELQQINGGGDLSDFFQDIGQAIVGFSYGMGVAIGQALGTNKSEGPPTCPKL